MIVLVHSGICDARMWDGFDLPGATTHEMRGFGGTPLPPAGEFSHPEDLEQALGGQPAALVGASFGGLVCLELAARRPELVSDLVLLDAPPPGSRLVGGDRPLRRARGRAGRGGASGGPRPS